MRKNMILPIGIAAAAAVLAAAAFFLYAAGHSDADKKKPTEALTEQESSAQKAEESPGIPAENSRIFESLEALKEYYRLHWQEKLLEEGRISEEGEIYAVSCDCSEEILKNYTREDLEVHITVITTDPAYHFWAYRTVLGCRYLDGKFYAAEREEFAYEEISTREQALNQPVFFSEIWEPDGVEAQEQGYLFYLSLRTIGDMAGAYAEEKDAARYRALQDPVTSAEEFLRLRGGNAEFIRSSLYFGILIYTFADNTQAHYYMCQKRGIWYPFYLIDDPERAERETEQARRCRDALENTSSEELRAVTTRAQIGAEPPKDSLFLLIQDIPEQDTALYGYYGDGGLVLRVKDDTYPLYLTWDIYYAFPDFYAGDYDGDGDTEYAIHIMSDRGTGISRFDLYILEIADGKLTPREFAYADWVEQLGRRLSFTYQDGLLEIFDSGEKIFGTTDLEPYLAERNLVFKTVGWGDIMDFVLKDGQWYYETTAGYCVEDHAMPEYEYCLRFTCPVSYTDDGTFRLGELTVGKDE